MKTRNMEFAPLMVSGLFFFALTGCNEEEKTQTEKITIGQILPADEAFGYLHRNAAQLAAQEINEAGGVLGAQLEIISQSDQSDEAVSIALATTMIDEQGAKAIIGPSGSGRFMAVTESVAKTKNIPVMSPTATVDDITALDDNNMAWRTIPANSIQATAAAEYAVDTLGVATASILYMDDDYGRDLAAAFQDSFESAENGGQVLAVVPYEVLSEYLEYDFEPLLEQVFADGPELVYFITSSGQAQIFQTIANRQDDFLVNDPVLMGCENNRAQSLADNAPDIIKGMYFVVPGNRYNDSLWPNFSVFVDNYIAQVESDRAVTDFGNAANTYDAVYLLAYAMVRAGSTEGPAIAAALSEVSAASGETIGVNEFATATGILDAGDDINYEGASGRIDFDSAGDVGSSLFVISRVNDSKQLEDIESFMIDN